MATNKLKEFRKARGMTQAELGAFLGFSQQTIASWERGRTDIPTETLAKIAGMFGISTDELLGIEPPPKAPKGVRIPVLGSIVAGIPIEAITEIEDWEEIPEAMARTGEFFALRVRGDSMEPVLYEGDRVICKRVPVADDGDIAVVLINGFEATLKKVYTSPAGVTLVAYNPSVYEPHFYSNKEVRTLPLEVQGVVVEMRRTLKARHY